MGVKKARGLNPWGLTDRQVEAMDAYVKHGSAKGAARVLGIECKTMQNHLMAVAGAMGTHLPGRISAWALWRSACANG